MATREYCSNVSLELEEWSEKLHKLSSEIDRISTGDKAKLFPQIEGLHILLTELDDRLCGLLESCGFTEERGIGGGVGETRVGTKFNFKGGEKFDYDVGG